MRVFKTEIPKSELLRRVGNLAQVASVELLAHEQGYARGDRFLDFRTGTGFRFSVHVDRGMDPGYAEFGGASLAWLPPKIFPAPAFWENDDHAWVRFVLGGLCNTAGLVTIGNPQTVDVSEFKFHSRHEDRYGTHDRVAILPASHFNYGERWEGERCVLWAEGTVRQEIVYGENLLLTRRYETALGSSAFTMRDVVRNDGFYPTPHQLLYHFNIGYPVVDEGAELLAAVSGEVGGSIFDEERRIRTSAIAPSAPPSAASSPRATSCRWRPPRTAGSRPPWSTAASRASTAVWASRCATTRPRCRPTSNGG